MPDMHDLELMLGSRLPILVIETHEEPRALDLVCRAGFSVGKPVFSWSVTEGLQRIDLEHGVPQRLTAELHDALGQIKSTERAGIYILCDAHPFLEDNPKNVRLMKEIAMRHDRVPHTLVLISHAINIPAEVKRYSAQMELSLPNDQQLLSMVREEAAHWSAQNRGQKVKTDSRTLNALVGNLRGLTYSDARRLARGAILDDGAITEDDLPNLNKAKFQLMDMDGVLSFEYDTADFADVGGLSRLKDWLQQRRGAFLGDSGENSGRDRPKGIMLLGIQGGGKSLAAKAVAGCWQVPLLRLDFGALFNKFIGETEKNLREALKLADMMEPCVLWMDEIEKGLSVDGNDNGTSKRILGTLLTWMAERKTRVFIVATSNDISRLPPELVRKGRMDEIFFVDLPDFEIRQMIFSIHLKKRYIDPDGFDLERLALASDGFSGAEIEQAVVAGLYACHAMECDLNTEHILDELANTSPLSVVMAEKMAQLRAWAQERTVSAN
ncbi:MAG: AAA family ATPase [Ketobacteraceae bacterium]|nr:AAA family ATPase [Ketobacteraceae bacterium]